jgi:hypothetical protein
MDTHPSSHTFYWVSLGKAMKVCKKCKVELSLSSFYKNSSRKDGLQKWCKPCCKTRDASRQRLYSAEIQARYKEKRNENYLKTRDLNKKRVQSHEHYLANKEVYIARAVARANKIRQSAICKADLKNVAKIYKEADRLRGQGHSVEVDHIVPLNGVNVSGLHVSWNLQIISVLENRAKGNKY